MYHENKIFVRNGHVCEMAEDLDQIYNIFKGDGWKSNVKRSFLHLISIDEMHPNSVTFLKNQAEFSDSQKNHIQNRPYVIHPFSQLRKYWEMYMCIIFWIYLFLVPVDIGYGFITRKHNSKQITTLKYFLVFSIISHIVIEFHTGYWDKKKKIFILKRKSISMKYIITYFLPDTISCLPTIAKILTQELVSNNVYSYLELAEVFIIFRVISQYHYTKLTLEVFGVPYFVKNYFLLTIYSIFYIHCFSGICLLLITSSWNTHYVPYYNKSDILQKTSFTILWVNNLYDCLVFCIGSGTLRLSTDTCFIYFQATFWIVSKILIVFFIARLALLVKAKVHSKTKNSEMILHLDSYMQNKGMPSYIRKRLLTYYRYRYKRNYFREEDIVNAVNGQLRQEITMENCRNLVEKVPFFRGLSLNFLVRLMSCMVEEIYLPNDVIIKANSATSSMYFIAAGTVAIYTPFGKEICHLQDGSYFGELSLIMPNQKRSASVIAVEICRVYKLERQDFLRAITPFPDLLCRIEEMVLHRLEDISSDVMKS